MLVRGVVRDDVDDHLDATCVGLVGEMVEVCEGAEPGVDVAIVADVVSAVSERGGIEGGQPDGVDSELGQIAQSAAQAGEVPDAVRVGVGEAAWIDLIHHRRAPPVGIDRLEIGVHCNLLVGFDFVVTLRPSVPGASGAARRWRLFTGQSSEPAESSCE